MRLSKILILVGAIGVSVSGCVRAQAKAPVAPVGLAVPEPPERRIVAAPEPDVPEPAPPPPAPAAAPASPRRDPVVTPRPDRGSPPASAPAPPPTPAPEPPPVLLQTNANPAEAEKQIRKQMDLAQSDVDRADKRPLSANGRMQLDATRGLLRQADDALKARNLTLARELADKAVSLASQLAR